MKTYYEILQVSEIASPEVLRAAWIALNREYHPDRQADGLTRAEQTMLCQFVNEAYKVLSDPVKRRAYDQDLKAKRRVHEMPSQSSGFNPEDWANRAYPDPYQQPGDFAQELLTNAAMIAGGVFQKHVMAGLPPELRTIIEQALRSRRKSA